MMAAADPRSAILESMMAPIETVTRLSAESMELFTRFVRIAASLMKNSRYIVRLLCVGACAVSTVLTAWIGFAQQTRQPDANALRNAAQSGEWLTYGGNYGETRYSTLRQIDATNVGRLGLAWTYN